MLHEKSWSWSLRQSCLRHCLKHMSDSCIINVHSVPDTNFAVAVPQFWLYSSTKTGSWLLKLARDVTRSDSIIYEHASCSRLALSRTHSAQNAIGTGANKPNNAPSSSFSFRVRDSELSALSLLRSGNRCVAAEIFSTLLNVELLEIACLKRCFHPTQRTQVGLSTWQTQASQQCLLRYVRCVARVALDGKHTLQDGSESSGNLFYGL